ncbi:MAG TPA: helix-turn-helix transcriptional regulator [Ornithinibacter sp.]|nr:helix-turn-helix transcriptional regulator [Ornithinibacter sp.]
MDDARGLPNEWVPHLRRARGALTVGAEVGLALRDHRRRLGLSQRAYALRRGLSRAMLARLEAGAGRMTLDTVADALDGTGFELFVGMSSGDPDLPPEGAASALAVDAATGPGAGVTPRRLPPEAWAPTDLVARVRGGGRRFPAHRPVHAVTEPPMWWWLHEFFDGPTEKPKWYSPVPRPDFRLLLGQQDDEDGETKVGKDAESRAGTDSESRAATDHEDHRDDAPEAA